MMSPDRLAETSDAGGDSSLREFRGATTLEEPEQRTTNKAYSTDRLTEHDQRFILNHMVEYTHQDLDAIFHALADPTRRAMLRTLASDDRTVSELAKPFAMSLAAASKHVKVLERAGLINRTVEGRTHICSLNAQPMRSTLEWIRYYEKFWGDRLDILESRLLAEDEIKMREDVGDRKDVEGRTKVAGKAKKRKRKKKR